MVKRKNLSHDMVAHIWANYDQNETNPDKKGSFESANSSTNGGVYWSYGTKIGFKKFTDNGDSLVFFNKSRFSNTTTKHQYAALDAIRYKNPSNVICFSHCLTDSFTKLSYGLKHPYFLEGLKECMLQELEGDSFSILGKPTKRKATYEAAKNVGLALYEKYVSFTKLHKFNVRLKGFDSLLKDYLNRDKIRAKELHLQRLAALRSNMKTIYDNMDIFTDSAIDHAQKVFKKAPLNGYCEKLRNFNDSVVALNDMFNLCKAYHLNVKPLYEQYRLPIEAINQDSKDVMAAFFKHLHNMKFVHEMRLNADSYIPYGFDSSKFEYANFELLEPRYQNAKEAATLRNYYNTYYWSKVFNRLKKIPDVKTLKEHCAKIEAREAAQKAQIEAMQANFTKGDFSTWQLHQIHTRDIDSIFKNLDFDVCRVSKDKKQIETLRGATVPIDHAIRIYKLFVRMIEKHENIIIHDLPDHARRVGFFKVDAVDVANQIIKIGCHQFRFRDLQTVYNQAKAQGLVHDCAAV